MTQTPDSTPFVLSTTPEMLSAAGLATDDIKIATRKQTFLMPTPSA